MACTCLLIHLFSIQPEVLKVFIPLDLFWLCVSCHLWSQPSFLCFIRDIFSFLQWICSPLVQISMVTYTQHTLQITPSEIFIEFDAVLPACMMWSLLPNVLIPSALSLGFFQWFNSHVFDMVTCVCPCCSVFQGGQFFPWHDAILLLILSPDSPNPLFVVSLHPLQTLVFLIIYWKRCCYFIFAITA